MDDSVFNRLYNDYHNDVFKFLIYLLRDRDQAEDLMHEVYVRVLKAKVPRKLGSFQLRKM